MILFLHGPDTYRSRQKIREIAEHYRKTYKTAIHLRDFDCAHAEFFDFKNEIEIISMFERKKLIILRNIFQNEGFAASVLAHKDALLKSENHIVVIVEEGEVKAKTKNALYQFLKKHAKTQEFTLLPPARLKQWIVNEFARFDMRVAPSAIELLMRATESDLWQLSNEISKIATFQKTKQGPLKPSDLALFVKPKLDADIFATIDAIAQKNKKRALGLLYRHIEKGDSPYYLFSMLVYQFRTMLEIRDMIEGKIPYPAMIQKSKLHPYVLKKGLQAAQNFSFQELKNIYIKLFRLDLALKTGKVEPEGVFDLLIAKL